MGYDYGWTLKTYSLLCASIRLIKKLPGGRSLCDVPSTLLCRLGGRRQAESGGPMFEVGGLTTALGWLKTTLLIVNCIPGSEDQYSTPAVCRVAGFALVVRREDYRTGSRLRRAGLANH